MSHQTRFDWTGFLVHLTFGSLLGGALGLGFWAHSPDAASSATSGLFYIAGAALVCGIIAGLAGDRFWNGLGDWFRRW